MQADEPNRPIKVPVKFTAADMTTIFQNCHVRGVCAKALARRKLSHQIHQSSNSFNPNADTIKVMTMHASKGLEFAVVALAGVGRMPGPGDDEREEARLFYVAATRAKQRLVITASGDGGFGRRFRLGDISCHQH